MNASVGPPRSDRPVTLCEAIDRAVLALANTPDVVGVSITVFYDATPTERAVAFHAVGHMPQIEDYLSTLRQVLTYRDGLQDSE